MEKSTWQKVLDFSVKLFSVAVTVPVSWIVAGQAFSDVHPVYIRHAIQFCAVALVDVLLIIHWTLLDTRKNAPLEQRIRYAVVSWTLYIGLWVLAFIHGEGVAGIVFRLSMGLALLSSTVDSFLVHWRDLLDKAQNGVRQDWRVQKHKRKLAREEEIEQRTLEHQKRVLLLADDLYRFTEQLKAEQVVFNREIVHDTQDKLNSIDYIEGKAVPVQNVQLLLQDTVQHSLPEIVQTVQNTVQEPLQIFVQELVQGATEEALQSMHKTVNVLVQEHLKNTQPTVKIPAKNTRPVNTPSDSLVLSTLRTLVHEHPEWTVGQLSDSVGISRSTFYNKYKDMLVQSNGNGHS